MNQRFLIVVFALLALPSVGIPAEFDDQKYSPQERAAAWAIATERAQEFTSEEVHRLYRQALESTSKCCQGTNRSEPDADEVPEGRFEVAIEGEFDESTITGDPTWQQNRLQMLRESPGSIIGGEPVRESGFPDVVFVRSDCCSCTGTLISPNVVVTAEHWLSDSSGRRVQIREVRIGSDYQSGRAFRVQEQIPHPNADIAVLILRDRVPEDVAIPRKIATSQQITAANGVRITGFGITEDGTQGVKMWGDAPIASTDCPSTRYGCRQGEFVAAGGDQDTCNGDSGGPAMVPAGEDYALAGVTSRAIARSGVTIINGRRYSCGYGGVYVSVPAFLEDFIRPAIRQNDGDPIGTSTEEDSEDSGETSVKPEVASALKTLRAAIDKLEAALEK